LFLKLNTLAFFPLSCYFKKKKRNITNAAGLILAPLAVDLVMIISNVLL